MYLFGKPSSVAHATGQRHKIYHLIKNLDNKSENLQGTIFCSERNPIAATAQTPNRWAEHLKDLLNRPLVDPVQPRHSAEQPLATVGTTSENLCGSERSSAETGEPQRSWH